MFNMYRRRCRNRQHVHFCRRHGRLHRRHHSKPGVPHPRPFGQRTVVAASSRMNPPEEATVWEDNCPDSLLDICTRFVLQHPQTYCCPKRANINASPEGASGGLAEGIEGSSSDVKESPIPFTLLPDLHLPTEICEKLFSTLHEEGLDIQDCTAGIFADINSCRLRRVNVRCSSITDHGLGHLIRHNLRDVDIHNCEALTSRTLENINKHSKHLVSLNIGNSVQILPDYIYPRCVDLDEDDQDSLDEEDRARTIYHERGYVLDAPALQKLCIRDLFVTRGSNYLRLLLKPLSKLGHLDLSGFHHTEGLGDLGPLKSLPMLSSLVLHNLSQGLSDEAVTTICQIKTLRHLDLSHHDDNQGAFRAPNETLSFIVESLPNLTSLDISGTNLAGRSAQTSKGKSGDAGPNCDIPGLVSRVNSPLDFLGLYKTSHEACYRGQIPAKLISGDANEKQILTAGRQYLDRPVVLENVLNDLFHIFRYEICSNLKAALDIILLAMDRHPGEKVIQISGSASLYYVVKLELKQNINVKMKKKILSTLLNGMFAHKNDSVMMRNGCLTLCQFSMPQDVIFDYERLVRILLYIVAEHNQPDTAFVQRAGIYLLNTLACQVDGQQKLLLGNLGAMERMLTLIRERNLNGICDDVMETAWSCMWNVTDETPINCKRFLDGGGMELFLKCKAQFPEKHDLLRNMMGLLGNVAEVPDLRPILMTPEFVSEFSHLLKSSTDGIEVSYNAAGVLAHMASDGPDVWGIESPTRQEVLDDMENAIEGWDLTTKRNINYRSFEPILRLVRVQHTPQCQHWAVWALANLTKVDAIVVCILVNLSKYLNKILKPLFGYSLHSGTTKRDGTLSRKWVHRSKILLRGKMNEVVPTLRTHFLLSHVGYESPEILFQDEVSLMAITPEHAIFAIVSKDIDVYDSDHEPFVYMTQFKLAQEILSIPLEQFVRFAQTLSDPKANVILLSSTGRCGSTLTTQMLEKVPNTITMSEPDAITSINPSQLKLMPQGIRDDQDALIQAVIRLQCKPLQSSDVRNIIIKTRSQSIALVTRIARIFPQIRHIFMYREPSKTIISFIAMMRGSNPFPDWIFNMFMARFRGMIYEIMTPECSAYDDLVEQLKTQPFDFVRMMGHIWILQVLSFKEARKDVAIFPLAYEDLLANPSVVFEELLDHCQMSNATIQDCIKAMDKDSQQGSSLSKQNLAKVQKKALTPEEIRNINEELAFFSLPPMDDYRKIFMASSS